MELVDNGTIRVLDLLFIMKAADGAVTTVEAADLDEDGAAFLSIDVTRPGALGAEDAEEVEGAGSGVGQVEGAPVPSRAKRKIPRIFTLRATFIACGKKNKLDASRRSLKYTNRTPLAERIALLTFFHDR
jgi:hypothetical protein